MDKEQAYFERYMVPDLYGIFKFGGSSVKDTERGIQTLLKYFPGYFTKKQLEKNSRHYNLQVMFEMVKEYFGKEYGFCGTHIELSNSYQNSINSYIYMDREKTSFIHVDELFESTMISFLLAMFKWTKEFEDSVIYGECFVHVLYLMNDVCIFGKLQGKDANEYFLNVLNGDIQILQLAEDCYWTIIAFCMAHEIAHAYLQGTKAYSQKHPENEEFDADGIAYRIVLKMIMEKKGEIKLENYTYMSPMIMMDFFDLYHYTDRVLYKTRFFDPVHPSPGKRKNRLFYIANNEEYEFDTGEGNDLYNSFLDVYDEYKEQLLLKMERGKLDKILRKRG